MQHRSGLQKEIDSFWAEARMCNYNLLTPALRLGLIVNEIF